MSIYMVVNSNQSLDYFPRNKPYHFQVHLKTPLLLEGVWKIGLSEIQIEDNHTWTDHGHLYIYTNICDESIIDGERAPLLRRLMSNEQGFWNSMFNPVFYLTVRKSEIYDIEFYIKSDKDQFATFLTQPVTLTLHFKAYPFLG